MNSYIQLQTTRKLPLFHGDLPITEMHRGTERTSYIPFPLNPETRSDVIPVRLHFSETLPQARQPISHRRLCVNNVIVSITSFQVSQGDFISLKENDALIYSEIRRSFYAFTDNHIQLHPGIASARCGFGTRRVTSIACALATQAY